MAHITVARSHSTTVLTHAGLFEVVEHSLLEDEPSPMLGLVLASLFCQPSLSLRVEEGLCQSTLTIRNFELLFLDIIIELLCVCVCAHAKRVKNSFNTCTCQLRRERERYMYMYWAKYGTLI